MSSALPPPVRAAAGLAARTLDEARRLPSRLISLPVLAAGAAMQASLRLQQEYAGLVARGDELIVALRGHSDEAPAWATFDEEATAGPSPGAPATEPGHRRDAVEPLLSPAGGEPSAFDLVPDIDAVTDHTPDLGASELGTRDSFGVPSESAPLVSTEDLLEAAGAPAAAAPVLGYDGWTVAQLRARLRRLSTEQLVDLLDYEQASRQRTPYVTMLQNRLAAASRG